MERVRVDETRVGGKTVRKELEGMDPFRRVGVSVGVPRVCTPEGKG